jgi:hypothetical protein
VSDYTGAPETPDGFLNEITFHSKVEKFINRGIYISISIRNLFEALVFECNTFKVTFLLFNIVLQLKWHRCHETL